jgi:hypothetical protein
MNARKAAGSIISMLVLAMLAEGGCATTGDEGEASHFSGCKVDTDCDSGQHCRREGAESRCVPAQAIESADGRPDADGAGNGEVDGGATGAVSCVICRVLDYDTQGRLVAAGYDNDCDGIADQFCAWYELDEDGGVTPTRTDEDCDGPLEPVCRVSREMPDGSIERFVDVGCDGQPDSDCSVTWTSASGASAWVYDRECDGGSDSCGGTDPSLGLYYSDGNCDGVADYCEFGDEHGNLIRVDRDCDGTYDSCVMIEYDERGRLLRSEADEDCDGSGDGYCTERTYASDGESYTEWRSSDCRGSGRCQVTVYSAPDGRSHDYQDFDCDGVPDAQCSESVDHGSGHFAQVFDDNCDGVADLCFVTLDESGKVITSVDATKCAGVSTECNVRRVIESP